MSEFNISTYLKAHLSLLTPRFSAAGKRRVAWWFECLHRLGELEHGSARQTTLPHAPTPAVRRPRNTASSKRSAPVLPHNAAASATAP
jgi:hypothetical protein